MFRVLTVTASTSIIILANTIAIVLFLALLAGLAYWLLF